LIERYETSLRYADLQEKKKFTEDEDFLKGVAKKSIKL